MDSKRTWASGQLTNSHLFFYGNLESSTHAQLAFDLLRLTHPRALRIRLLVVIWERGAKLGAAFQASSWV